MPIFKLCDSFHSRLYEHFDNYNDVFIHTDDDDVELKAHKLILAMHSSYFHTMFQKRVGNTAEIFVLNIPVRIVKAAINFMYGKETILSKKDAGRFTKLISKWKVNFSITTDDDETIEETSYADELDDSFVRPSELNDTFVRPSKFTKESKKPEEAPTQETSSDLDLEVSKTSSAEIVTLLKFINHEVFDESINLLKTKAYKCVECKTISKHIQQAQNHFTLEHQDNEHEIKILKNAQIMIGTNNLYFANLLSDIESGKIESFVSALMDSSVNMKEMSATLEKVESINKPVLPPTLERKQRGIVKTLGELIKKANICSDKLDA